MSTQTAAEAAIDDLAESSFPVFEILAGYGTTIVGILYLIIGPILTKMLTGLLIGIYTAEKILFEGSNPRLGT